MQQLLAARQARGADGGLLTVLLACRLVLGAWRRRLPARLCAALLPEVLARALRAILSGSGPRTDSDGVLVPAAAPLRLSDLPSLLAIVRGVLAPKRVAVPGAEPADIEQLAVLIVSAFVRSLPDDSTAASADAGDVAEARAHGGSAAARAASLLPGVRPMHVIGPRVEASEVLEGVLIDTGWPLGATLPVNEPADGHTFALYNISLEAALPEGIDAAVRLTSVVGSDGDGDEAHGETVWRPLAAHDEHAAYEGGTTSGGGGVRVGRGSGQRAAEDESEILLVRFADGVAAAGVRVLGCQQRVAPALTRLLLARGVLPLPRLSLRHIAAVRRLTGATPLSHLAPPTCGDLGRVGTVRRLERAGRSYLHLQPPPPRPRRSRPGDAVTKAGPSPVVTLILCAPNRTASDELAAVASCALGTIGAALTQRSARLLPAAGSFEVVLSAELRKHASTPAVASGGGERARALERLRVQVCELLSEALDEVVVALAGGGLVGRDACDSLHAANEAALTRHRESGSGARSFIGWDAELELPCEVLRMARPPAAGGGASGSSSSSSDDDGDDDGDGSRRRRTKTTRRQPQAAGPVRVEFAGVAELESEKLEAVYSAIEVACSVMGVDQVIIDPR